jgi:hypothetical protein
MTDTQAGALAGAGQRAADAQDAVGILCAIASVVISRKRS